MTASTFRRRTSRVALGACGLALIGSGLPVAGDAAPPPSRFAAQPAAAAPAPGLAQTVAPGGGAQDGALASDTRRVRTLALHVPRGQAPTPFTRRGPFRVTWRGFLDVPRRDRFTFGFQGSGSFRLELDGEVVLEFRGRATDAPELGDPVRLRAGRRELVAVYQAPLSGQGDARVFWQCRKFGLEPIPPTALSHDPTDADLVAGEQRRAGRMLFATRRCVTCHDLGDAAAAMPEFDMRGPDLTTAGARLQRDWIAAWVAAPRALRAEARMPHVDLGDDPERTAADIAAFLAARGADAAPAPPEPAGDRRAGAVLFTELGCFACHGFDAAGDSDAGGDREAGAAWLALDRAGAKYRPGALAAFLQQPGRHDPWIRMPDLRLTADEARHLAAFVRARGQAAVPEARAGDAARGRAQYAALGCADCHVERGEAAVATTRKPAPDLATLVAGGAESFRDGCAALDFGFDAAAGAALAAFAAAEPVAAAGRHVPAEVAARQFGERRCIACHQFDGETAWWVQRERAAREAYGVAGPDAGSDAGSDAGRDAAAAADAGEQVEVRQLRPALTLVGEKLSADWLRDFIAGEAESPRPWLRARMPRIPVLAADLAHGLAHQHGIGREPAEFTPEPQKVAIGRRLIEQQGGFGCVTCHGVGERMPVALFEVQGINLARVADRLRPEYYRRWMMDPERIEPAAKMPRYPSADGRTALEPYDGDAAAQFDAIWHFIHGADELR